MGFAPVQNRRQGKSSSFLKLSRLSSGGFLLALFLLWQPFSTAEARISKGLKRPQRLVTYSPLTGPANLTLNAIPCPDFCLGTPYQLSNIGTGPTSPIGFNLPPAPTTPELDGELLITSDCPSTLSPGSSCRVEVILEDGGLFIGCITFNLIAEAGKIAASAGYDYGDCSGGSSM